MKPNTSFSFLKNNYLAPTGASFTHLYGPILGVQASQLYTFLLSLYDQGKEKRLIAVVLNHLDLGFAHFLESLDRLIAMNLLEVFETDEGLQFRFLAPLEADQFFANVAYQKLLEKKIGEAAVRDFLPEKPEGEKRKVNFASVFGIDGVSTPQRKVSSFSLEHFKQLMVRDGLRFENEQEDLLVLYAITEEKNWTWYETYLLAKETAVNLVISTKRMRQKLTQEPQEKGKDEFTPQERAIIREAKNKTSRQFLAGIKKARKAVVTQSERQVISDLARLGLLDEVINVILLLTFNKVASANLNEKYALKVGNDFAYEGIKMAEEAVLKIRQRQDSHLQKAKEKVANSGSATGKTNVPKWSQPNYTNQTSQEEQANLEQQKRALLEKLNQGGE